MEERERKRIRPGQVLYYALLVIFAAVFLTSLFFLGRYWLGSKEAGSDYDDLAHLLESIQAAQPTKKPQSPDQGGDPGQPDQPADPTEPEETVSPTLPNGMLVEYGAIYAINSDTVGWIKIPDTKINYPVVQSKDQRDYYLNRSFYKKWSAWGAIYAREECDINAPSDNITLYGHHMQDGSMFAGLDKFKKKDFWEDHQTFTFDTLYEHHTYQIIAVFKTSANLDEGFMYHKFSDAQSEEEFNEFVATVKKLAFYDTGLTAEYGDKLLCLSTCEYTLNNGRFVVVAKRIS